MWRELCIQRDTATNICFPGTEADRALKLKKHMVIIAGDWGWTSMRVGLPSQRNSHVCGLPLQEWMLLFTCSVVLYSLQPHGLELSRLLCSWNSSGKKTGVGCHFLLQGIFLTQGSNPHLLHWQANSLPLNHKGSPQEWIPSICCEAPGKISLWLCQAEKKSTHQETLPKPSPDRSCLSMGKNSEAQLWNLVSARWREFLPAPAFPWELSW